MPEGDSLHQLAGAFNDLFVGADCRTWSPQGRFAHGSEVLDGRVMAASMAHGKHLFLAFDDAAGERLWLHVHLGLYGAWRFYRDPSVLGEGTTLPDAIGAPRAKRDSYPAWTGTGTTDDGIIRVRTEHLALTIHDSMDEDGAPAAASSGAESAWNPPEPVGAVRLRIEAPASDPIIVADLNGPNQCEVLTDQERLAVIARLGPDPLAPGAADDAEARDRFVDAVRKRRRDVGELCMDQSIVAGVGNIYRAESLFLTRINPHRKGANVSAARLRELWAEICRLMARGLSLGRIVTVDPEDAPAELIPGDEEASRFYVYRRTGRPCLRCGTPIAEGLMQARKLYWCPNCQR